MCVTYIQFTVINESTLLHIYFKWGIFMAFEPEFAKQLEIVFANSVLDNAGFPKEFSNLYRFIQDNSTS